MIFENSVPEFVASALEKLYHNIYCTTARFELYDSLAGVSTYVSMAEAGIETIILYRTRHRDVIEVLNQQIYLSGASIQRFCETIFSRYPFVRRIGFYALNTPASSLCLEYPHQWVPQIEEHIASLPGSIDEYHKSMSPQTRARILKSIRKTSRDYPSYRFELRARGEIEVRHLEEIVRLANERMKSKDMPAYIGQSDIAKLFRLAQSHGYIGLVLIDEKIYAGTLCFNVGQRYFSQLIAHDPCFDAYGLGNQVQLQILWHCIAAGSAEFWMMGGGQETKERFLTQRRIFHSLTVYRSRKAALLSPRHYAQNRVRTTTFACRETLKEAAATHGLAGRALKRTLDAARAVRLKYRRMESFTADFGHRS